MGSLMSKHDHPFRAEGVAGVADPLGTVVLAGDCQHDFAANDALLNTSEQFGHSTLARQ